MLNYIELKAKIQEITEELSKTKDSNHELTEGLQQLMNELSSAKDFVQKLVKQLKDKDIFINNTIKTHEIMYENMNQAYEKKINNLKHKYEKGSELIYAVQDLKHRTTAKTWNGSETATQTDESEVSNKVDTEIQTELINPDPPSSPKTLKSKSIQVNTIPEEKYKSESESENLESIHNVSKYIENGVLYSKIGKLKSKYKHLKEEYSEQNSKFVFSEQIKTKYQQLYQSWHELLKKLLIK